MNVSKTIVAGFPRTNSQKRWDILPAVNQTSTGLPAGHRQLGFP
jgi:hypothetical protein